MASRPFSMPVGEAVHDWVVEHGSRGRIIWLLPGTASAAHRRRLLEAALAVVPDPDFDVPRGRVLTGLWPDRGMLAPFAEAAGGAEPGWQDGLLRAVISGYLPPPADGTPFAVLSASLSGHPSSFGKWSREEAEDTLYAAAEAGIAALEHSVSEQGGGLDIVFSHSRPVGILTARAPRGASPERLDAAFATAVEGMLKADPGAFAPWPPWADRRPGAPVRTLPGDGGIEPLGMALFRVDDPARAQSAVDLGVAAGRGGIVPPPEAPS